MIIKDNNSPSFSKVDKDEFLKLKEDKKLPIQVKRNKTKKEIEETKENIQIVLPDLINSIKEENTEINEINEKEKKKTKKASTTDENKQPRKKRLLKERNRMSRDEKIVFTIEEKDDSLVRNLKEIINDSCITMESIYSKISEPLAAYNLFYGLATRNTISWKNFEKWIDILDKDIELIIKDKNY